MSDQDEESKQKIHDLTVGVSKNTAMLQNVEKNLAEHKDIAGKFSEMTYRIEKMVVIHEERIDQQRLDVMSIRRTVEELKSTMILEFKESTVDHKKNRLELHTRINHLEKWRWLVVGGVTCIGILIHFIITLVKHIQELGLDKTLT